MTGDGRGTVYRYLAWDGTQCCGRGGASLGRGQASIGCAGNYRLEADGSCLGGTCSHRGIAGQEDRPQFFGTGAITARSTHVSFRMHGSQKLFCTATTSPKENGAQAWLEDAYRCSTLNDCTCPLRVKIDV
jgi:hypothetical protein